MRGLTVCVLAMAAANLATAGRQPEDVLQQVSDELTAEDLSGVSPKRRRRATPTSRLMSRRNALLRRGVARLVEGGLGEEEAREAATRVLRSSRGHGRRPGGFNGFNSKLPDRPSAVEVCDPTGLACPTSKYRSADGTCNNLASPYWGAANIAMRRYINASYADSRDAPTGGFTSAESLAYSSSRKAGRGHNSGHHSSGHHSSSQGGQHSSEAGGLPGARLVSLTFHPDVSVHSGAVTHMVTQLGQFLDHDITLTPEEEEHDCCAEPDTDNCFPIALPLDDSFYSLHSQTCLEFTRSTAYCEDTVTTREQMNAITAFVDASNVYGSSAETTALLRSGQGGELRVNSAVGYSRDILPEIDGLLQAGDVRALEMPGLATLHTLWLREHNRLARQIQEQGQTDDETIFQTARRILIAEMQNVVYSEYLPVVLGQAAMARYRLELPRSHSDFSTYSADKDPSIANSFATAAYRFGHSMIQGLISMMSTTTANLESQFQLRENYFNMANYLLNDGEGMEQILQGLINQPAQEMDRFVTEDVTNHLFPEVGHHFGSDLVARNIQRGRDHGLPGYNSWRKFCGLSTIRSMSDVPREISRDQWAVLKTLYSSPEKIDLFTAGLAESPVEGGLTGHTFNCIKARQFRDLKDGDRYFFTHKDQEGSFTKDQLREIRPRRLRDIICDNSGIVSTRAEVLLVEGDMEDCRLARGLHIQTFL